jgi:hypothetical protein
MAGSLERSELRVEGDDDQHSIIHLLRRNGIDFDVRPWPPGWPTIEKAGGYSELLSSVETAVRLGSGRVVGFVLDADRPLRNRWDAVKARLARVGIETPDDPQPAGLVGQSQQYRTRVGVWLMPDNQNDGNLEDFLRTLIDENDGLIEHARSATERAIQLGAAFPLVDRLKAIIHAWLAWQEEPGLPYGTAIRAKFFRHDSPVAARFVQWFRILYGI